MSQDLAQILTGAPANPGGSDASLQLDPSDAAIRTIYGEAPPNASAQERQAIAAVIANRARASGKSYDQVVQEPGQFEPWQDPKARKRLLALDPEDPAYQAIKGDVGDILAGKANPYPQLQRFYSPGAQKALGRPKPQWDDGSGQQIGAHLFFAGNPEPVVGGGAQDLGAILTANAASPEAPGQKAAPDDAEAAFHAQFGDPGLRMVSYEGLKAAPYPEQQATWKALTQSGNLDKDQPAGSAMNPYWVAPGQDLKDSPPGSYVVDPKGAMHYIAKPGEAQKSSFLEGSGQGLGDVMLSIGHALPGAGGSDVLADLRAHQIQYGADYGGDLKSGLGRFVGQAAASAPLIAGGEELAAPAAIRALGPIGEFLTGQAGKAALPEGAGLLANLARLGARGASLATAGAGEGGAGAALTSSASDQPLADQLQEGAIGGAILRNAAPAVTGLGRSAGRAVAGMIRPLTESGRAGIAEDAIRGFGAGANMQPSAEELIPGSIPTLAQATANPGIATLERTVRLARPIPFAERAAQNSGARSDFLSDTRGDEQTVADLVRNRQEAIAAAREGAFKDTKQADSASAVNAIDEVMGSPAAQMDSVAGPLTALRGKIVAEPETTPEEIGAFNRGVAGTFGADGEALTPELMDSAKQTIGGKLNALASKSSVPWDDQLRTDLGNIAHEASQVLPEASIGPLLKQIDNIASVSGAGSPKGSMEPDSLGKISGEAYQNLTKKGAPLDRLQNSSDPNLRFYANQMRDALDDALERGTAPEDKAALSAARLQYKNMKTAEAALRTAGPESQVTPEAVMAAVKRNFQSFAYKGGGPLGDIAQEALKAKAAKAPTVETDPQQLFGMRENLSQAIEKLRSAGDDASTHAADALEHVRESLDNSIEGAASGYKAYLDISKSSLEPIEAQKFLQGLRLTDAQGKIQLGRVQGALDRLQTMRAAPGDNPAKKVTDDTLARLESLRDDLLREKNSELGGPIGSHTAQHLATGNISEGMNVPLALGAGMVLNHPIIGPAVGLGKIFYGMKNQQVLDALANRLVSPEPLAEKPLGPVDQLNLRGPLKRAQAPALAATGGVLANAMLGFR